MDEQEEEKIRSVAEAWEVYGQRAEELRIQELRGLKQDDVQGLVDSLLQIGAARVGLRPSSGLVEQQRLFAILREKKRQAEEKKNE